MSTPWSWPPGHASEASRRFHVRCETPFRKSSPTPWSVQTLAQRFDVAAPCTRAETKPPLPRGEDHSVHEEAGGLRHALGVACDRAMVRPWR